MIEKFILIQTHPPTPSLEKGGGGEARKELEILLLTFLFFKGRGRYDKNNTLKNQKRLQKRGK